MQCNAMQWYFDSTIVCNKLLHVKKQIRAVLIKKNAGTQNRGFNTKVGLNPTYLCFKGVIPYYRKYSTPSSCLKKPLTLNQQFKTYTTL